MAHHDPFKSLGPIDWSTVTDQEAAGSLPALRASALADAQTLINSIPGAATVPPPPRHTTGRARAATDSAVDFDSNSSGNSGGGGADALLRREWKAVRAVGDNPHLISVHRLAGRDGRGAWFARRSVHPCRASGGLLGFGRWREGLEGEFEETMRRAREGGGEPGTGNVRGIGAERRVEERDLGGGGALKVYQLSARFPGPTTPRDFVTLLLTSNDPQGDDDGNNRNRRPRQFMVISKPCIHPDCPQRQGFVRGQYESVEVVREIPVDKPLRRVRSSIDLGSDAFSRGDSGNPGKEALLRSARQAATNSGNLQARPDNRMVSFAAGPVKQSKSETGSDDEDEPEMAIEWLMITRSDPGGSVPRFMVERGTPPGIVNDAGRLLDWLSRKQSDTARREAIEAGGADADEPDDAKTSALPGETKMTTTNPGQTRAADEAPNAGPGGFYGMITSALEAAGSAVVGKMHDAPDSYQGTEDDDEDDTSSSASFASAEEGEPSSSLAGPGSLPADEVVSSSRSAQSAVSGESQVPSAASTSAAQRDKTLRKLEERHRKAREKAAREHERALAKRKEGEEKDAQAAARLRDKHEKELARREEKYMREVRKLEEKRARAAEREGRAGLQAELERTRAERDVALKQVEMLRDQVGELQTQNTRLVARMGKMGGMAGAEASWDDLRKAPGQETKARSRQD